MVLQVLSASKKENIVIKGKVTDENRTPIQFTTVSLINLSSNKIVNGSISDENGNYDISNVTTGKYKLSVTMVGYESSVSDILEVNGLNTMIEKDFTLKESVHIIDEVKIMAKKQLIEQLVDKIVVNPGVSATASSENVYDLLQKLPGVSVDNNDNISLKGITGVKVMIDNKETYLSGTQLASVLKGMQGKDVDKIELIQNPSAKYDAEGNSGIINIKTKHNQTPGFNGSVNGGIRYNSYFAGDGGLNLNLKVKNFNLYGNYSLYNWAGNNGFNALRNFTDLSLIGATQNIYSSEKYHGTSQNYKFGIDYYPFRNHVVSIMYKGYYGGNSNENHSTTKFLDANNVIDSILNTTALNSGYWQGNSYNFNYKWDVDTLGQSLTLDLNYAINKYNDNENQDGKYSDGNKNQTNTINILKNEGNAINIYTAKLDYSLPVKKTIQLDAGLKLSSVQTDNYMNMSGYLVQNDHFIYKENIQAGYVNAQGTFKKTMIQLGLRLENTVSIGNSVSENTINDTTYLKFFPSFFIQQTLNDKNSLNFQYSYRIGRPDYDMLNPFKWMVDPYTYNVGNPFLRPQFTHSMSFTHNYNSMFITTLGYSYTKEMFTEFIYQDDANRSIYQTNENLNNSLDLNLSESFRLQLTKWWNTYGNIMGLYKKIDVKTGSEGDELSRFSYMGNINNNFSLPWKLNMELNAFYRSSSLIGNIVTYPNFTVDWGIQRKILNDKGSIKLSINDIFNSRRNSAYVKYNNVDMSIKQFGTTRRVNFSFTYNFGNNNFKTRANRATSSTEEESRSQH